MKKHSKNRRKSPTKLTIAPKTKIILKQLTGRYAGHFKVGADRYKIEEEKVTKRSYIYYPRKWKSFSKFLVK